MTVTGEASHDNHGADGHGDHKAKAGFWALALGSVGVVYGDIGTSPLYAMREALHHAAGAAASPDRGGDRRRLAPAVGADPHRHRASTSSS